MSSSVTVEQALRRGWSWWVLSSWRRRREVVPYLLLLTVGFTFLQVLLLLVIGKGVVIRQLRDHSRVILEVREGASDPQIQSFRQALLHLPFVTEVVHVTREQAYERQRERNPEIITFLETYGLPNPFVDTVGIALRSLTDYDRLLGFLRRPELQDVIDPRFLSVVTNQEQQVRSLLLLHRTVQRVLLLLLVGGVCLLTLLTLQATQLCLTTHRRRVMIQNLVGASTWSLQRPFLIEVTAFSLSSFLIASIIVGEVVVLLPRLLPLAAIQEYDQFFSEFLAVLRSVGPVVFLLEVVAIVLLAVVGVILGLGRSTHPLSAFSR